MITILWLFGYFILATACVANILGYDSGLIITLPTFGFEVSPGLYFVMTGFAKPQNLIAHDSERITI